MCALLHNSHSVPVTKNHNNTTTNTLLFPVFVQLAIFSDLFQFGSRQAINRDNWSRLFPGQMTIQKHIMFHYTSVVRYQVIISWVYTVSSLRHRSLHTHHAQPLILYNSINPLLLI